MYRTKQLRVELFAHIGQSTPWSCRKGNLQRDSAKSRRLMVELLPMESASSAVMWLPSKRGALLDQTSLSLSQIQVCLESNRYVQIQFPWTVLKAIALQVSYTRRKQIQMFAKSRLSKKNSPSVSTLNSYSKSQPTSFI